MARRDKLVISFDEASRKAFVTGFRSRKKQRRAAAERGRSATERASKLAERAARRAAEAPLLEASSDAIVRFVPDCAPAVAKETPADDFSARVFGAATVRVTTTVGLPGEDDAVAEAEKASLLAFAMRHKEKTHKVGTKRPRSG